MVELEDDTCVYDNKILDEEAYRSAKRSSSSSSGSVIFAKNWFRREVVKVSCETQPFTGPKLQQKLELATELFSVFGYQRE